VFWDHLRSSAAKNQQFMLFYQLALLEGVSHCCAWHVQVPSGLIGSYIK
jgi:hypothetical protein